MNDRGEVYSTSFQCGARHEKRQRGRHAREKNGIGSELVDLTSQAPCESEQKRHGFDVHPLPARSKHDAPHRHIVSALERSVKLRRDPLHPTHVAHRSIARRKRVRDEEKAHGAG